MPKLASNPSRVGCALRQGLRWYPPCQGRHDSIRRDTIIIKLPRLHQDHHGFTASSHHFKHRHGLHGFREPACPVRSSPAWEDCATPPSQPGKSTRSTRQALYFLAVITPSAKSGQEHMHRQPPPLPQHAWSPQVHAPTYAWGCRDPGPTQCLTALPARGPLCQGKPAMHVLPMRFCDREAAAQLKPAAAGHHHRRQPVPLPVLIPVPQSPGHHSAVHKPSSQQGALR